MKKGQLFFYFLEKKATRTVPFRAVLAFFCYNYNDVLSKSDKNIILQLVTHCLQRPTIRVTSGRQCHC